MLKVKLLKNCGIGFESKKAGEVVELSVADARYLVAVGKAEVIEVEAEVEVEVEVEPEVDPEVESESIPSLKKLKKAELIEIAKELGIEELSGTNAELIEAIEAVEAAEDNES